MGTETMEKIASRAIDDLGRIVLPAEARRKMEFEDGDGVDMYLQGDMLILKRHSNLVNEMKLCVVCATKQGRITVNGKCFCDSCIDNLSELKNK